MMQMDYYRSPSQFSPYPGQAAPLPPTGEGAPRRKRRGTVVLVVFLALIAAALLALAVVQITSWGGQRASRDLDPGFSFGDPDGFYDYYFSEREGGDSGVTTIRRADPDPNVRMELTSPPGSALGFQEIYEKVLPSIVSIQSTSGSSAYSGTGVVLTGDGYLITNHHVIAGCSSAQAVLSDGKSYDAKLVGSDVASDLAVLKINARGLTPAEFGDSDLVRVGDTALAIGNPLGSDLFGTMTEGIISAINRDVNVDGYSMTLIQTTAALNPGNSGGALVNSAGQVVGITNLKMMSSYETIEGLGFAIPTVWAKEVVDALLSDGAITGRPTIGILCSDLTQEEAEQTGLNGGVYVESVTAAGPAERAGVRQGDIIVAANGESVESMEDLTAARDGTGAGGDLTLTIWRDGETLELTLTLVEQYELN